MTWRIHLTNQAIQYADILQGEPDLLAVRLRRDEFAFFDLDSGVQFGELRFEMPVSSDDRSSPEWREFLKSLTAPNGVGLSDIVTPAGRMLTTEDGGIRLYQASATALRLFADGRETTLDRGGAEAFAAAALDRLMGLVVAVDNEGKIHIFQQHRRVGAFSHGLRPAEESTYSIAVAHGGSVIYVSDGSQIVALDSAGRAKGSRSVSYTVRQMTCSPDGKLIVTSDMDIGLIRMYRASDLALVRQRFAIDLILDATQVQLMAEIPPRFVAPGALRIDNAGRFALTMAGVVCVTHLEYLDQIPTAAQV